MTTYYVTAGPRKNLANPDAPRSGWVRSLSGAYHFRSAKRAKRIAARMRAKSIAARVGGALVTTPYRCPLCGASIEVDERGKVFEPTFIQQTQRIGYLGRIAPIAFCTGCEFCLELPNRVDAPRASK